MPDITAMFNLLSQPLRLHRRTTTLSDPSTLRPTVYPPSLRHAPEASGAWQRLMFWLMGPTLQDAAPPPSRLTGVRTEFMATLADIDSEGADTLRRRVADARSLRELWHLRAEVYRIVGIAHSQFQAEERVALLNRHFPTRAPRSQFAPL